MSAEELLGVFGGDVPVDVAVVGRVVLLGDGGTWKVMEIVTTLTTLEDTLNFNQVWLTLKCVVKRSTQCTWRKICLQYSSCVVGFGSYAATNVHQQSTNKSKKQSIRFSEKLRLSYLEEMDAVAESFLLSATALGQVSSLTLRIEELHFSHGTSKKYTVF